MACLASSGIKRLQFGLGLFMLRMDCPGAGKDAGKLRPGIGARHVDDSDRLKARFWRIDPKQARRLAVLDAAPELAFCREDQVLVQRICVRRELDPFSTAGDDRQYGCSGRHHPHVVLKLGHVFGRSRLLGERPRQHELGFKHRARALDQAIKRGPHPMQHRVADVPLDIRNDAPGIGLIPVPIKVLGHHSKLDNEIAGQVLRLDLAALLPPQPYQRGLVSRP